MLSNALKQHGIPSREFKYLWLTALTSCGGSRRSHAKLVVLLLAAAAICVATMYWGVPHYGVDFGSSFGQEAKFSKYRFTPRSHRKDVPIQIAEIEFKSPIGIVSLAAAMATNLGGENPQGEGPDKAIDGDPTTQWADSRHRSIVVDFSTPIALTSFRFTLATGPQEGDPTQWTMEGSNGDDWTMLHVQNTDFLPASRTTATEWFDWFDFDFNEIKPQSPLSQGQFLHYRFTPSKIRRHEANAMQISEIEFRQNDDLISVQYDGNIRVDSRSGSAPEEEGVDKAIDGDTNTKWLDFLTSFHTSELTISWNEPQRLTSFRFVTANDFSGRDPVRWKLQGSNDRQSWALLHEQNEDYATPILRRTPTEWFILNLDTALELEQEDNHTGAPESENYALESEAFCFTPMKLRNNDSGVMELSELEFGNGKSIVKMPRGTFAEQTEGNIVASGEPFNAVDEDASTAWVSIYPSTLCVTPMTPMYVTSFRFQTGPGSTARDPVRWKLEHRIGPNSTLLHLQSMDYATPVLRQAPTDWFEFSAAALGPV